jgi:hypothetical protein
VEAVSPIATDPPRRRWRRLLAALVALLVARELFPLPLDLFASRHGFGAIAMAQRRDRDGLRPSIDHDHPTAGFAGLLLFDSATSVGLAVPSRVDAADVDRAAGGFSDRAGDPAFELAIAGAVGNEMQRRFAGDEQLHDARINVLVPFAARGGADWIPLWKQMRAAVAIEIAVVPKSAPAVDFAGHVVRRAKLLGPCSARGAREREFARLVDKIADDAEREVRRELAD